MATASAQITIYYVVDIQATYRYYLLQSSTLTAPSKPTTYPPDSAWDDTEPTYVTESTNSLYYVDCTVFCNDTFQYSDVSLSTAYEAAKAAYNKADNAEKQTVIQSDTEPSLTTYMWLDTSVEPALLKRYNSETLEWEAINDTSSLDTALYELEQHVYTEIANTEESIISTVAEQYYLKSEAEQLATEMSTQIIQTAEDLSIQFKKVNTDLEDLTGKTDSKFEEIRKYIRFDDGKILLGESGNQLELVISNNSILFTQNKTPVAYFSNNKLYVIDGEFTRSLRLGNFAYLPRTNGNLSFKKI